MAEDLTIKPEHIIDPAQQKVPINYNIVKHPNFFDTRSLNQHIQNSAGWHFLECMTDYVWKSNWQYNVIKSQKLTGEYEYADNVHSDVPQIVDKIMGIKSPNTVIERMAINGASQGAQCNIHADYVQGYSLITTHILYLVDEWSPEWGGATIFYDHTGTKEIERIYPEPGLMIEYDGRILHKGGEILVDNKLRTNFVVCTYESNT